MADKSPKSNYREPLAAVLALKPAPGPRPSGVRWEDNVATVAVRGDLDADKALFAAMRGATIDSPRGKFTLSAGHNPVQNIYLREARGGLNKVLSVAAADLADPGTGCKLV